MLLLVTPAGAAERADFVVAGDGSGDFATIQEAIDAIPAENGSLKIILIRRGVYAEKLRITKDRIALVGEDMNDTRIVYHQPFYFDSTYADGRAVINIHADDIILANLTAENTQPDVNIHAFTVYGDDCTRTIILHCRILSNGGDTLALWNGENGMYYHHSLILRGAVDFLCPRGWCYAENIAFHCTRKTTPLWHDGSKHGDQKLVVKNASFDGATDFRLGRNHLDGAFYLLDCTFSEGMIDQPFYRPESSPAPYQWGRRAYFHGCVRPAGNYAWHADNLQTAPGSPRPEEITASWTFGGRWDPEASMPPVLPEAFLPRPSHQAGSVGRDTALAWVSGRNAVSHRLYFGTSESPPFLAELVDNRYCPPRLESGTPYYWRVDEVTEEGVVRGRLWRFRTSAESP